jgi:hypothetical protein
MHKKEEPHHDDESYKRNHYPHHPLSAYVWKDDFNHSSQPILSGERISLVFFFLPQIIQ